MNRARSLPSTVLPILFACSNACSMEDIIPKTGFEAGERSALVSVDFVPLSINDLSGSFDNFRLSIIDVLIHRPTDDAWLILNDSEATYSISESEKHQIKWSAIPIAVGDYDAIQIVFEDAYIHAQDRWQPAELLRSEWTHEQTISIDENVTLEIGIDATNSIDGNSIDGWQIDPRMSLDIKKNR